MGVDVAMSSGNPPARSALVRESEPSASATLGGGAYLQAGIGFVVLVLMNLLDFI